MTLEQCDIKKIRRENKELLQQFKEWLRQKKVSENLISIHVQNCDSFLNEFLAGSDVIPAKEGFRDVSMFLVNWFIKKANWSSPEVIKSSAVSLVEFYTFLYEREDIEKDDFETFTLIIENEKSKCMVNMRWYTAQEADEKWFIWK